MQTVPKHIAIIMDGNGRWAKQRALPRTYGHKEGLNTVKKVLNWCIRIGTKYVSLYVFSTENWSRPRAEVNALFSLASTYLSDFRTFCEKGIRVIVTGERDKLPPKLISAIDETERMTENNDTLEVNLCINYGGRREIVEAAKKLISANEEITEESIRGNMYCCFPDPDMILRTGGQRRLSNFLTYESAYSELFFSDTLWPDFSEREFEELIDEYGKRVRTFGGLT